jgi:hypothetical protein
METASPQAVDLDLPTRFHIGTPKAASSFLFNLLRSHGDASLSPQQKINFYSLHFDRGFDWYLSTFPADGIRIDTSPTYIRMGEVVAPRIKEAVGEDAPQFLVVLRNPIDYARSHYQMSLRQGTLGRMRDRYPVLPVTFVEFAHRYDDWLDMARYAHLLRDVWFSQFNPSQFKIVLFEDLITETDRVGAEVLDFFGLPPRPLTATALSQNRTLRHPALHVLRRTLNRGPRGLKEFIKRRRVLNALYLKWMAQRDDEMSPGEREALAALLADDVAALKQLLGTDIPQWPDFASTTRPGASVDARQAEPVTRQRV